MNSHHLSQLDKLEILFSEQQHTVQVLNEIVSRQDMDIAKLKSDYLTLKRHYLDLKSRLPAHMTSVERPPHY